MNHLVDQYFDSLTDKRVAVLGIGVSNRPLIRMLLARGICVLACDKTPREKLDAEVLELEQAGAVLHVGEHYLDDVQADIVFRTPGMHPDIPALRQLRESGAEITSEMEVFFEVCPCHIIAVTGSDGKTTTTTLIAKILEHAGHRVWIGGNIGAPLLPQAADMTPTDIAVVELSSFQLMTMERSADIAVVTNVAPGQLPFIQRGAFGYDFPVVLQLCVSPNGLARFFYVWRKTKWKKNRTLYSAQPRLAG